MTLQRILVVDDEPAMLKMLSAVLTRANYVVKTALSARAALDLLKDHKYDCIITDAIMPSMSGFELVKLLRDHPEAQGVPILMLTRKRHREDVKRAIDAGVSDYVLKPIDEHILLDKVELAIHRADAERHVFEMSLVDTPYSAELTADCRIVSLGENGLTIVAPFPIEDGVAFELASLLFNEVGIETPLLKLLSCERARIRSTAYEIRFTFVGMPEEDLKRIRTWIQRESIRRRREGRLDDDPR